MRKSCISFYSIVLIMCSHLCCSVPVSKSSTLRARLNPYYLKAVAAFKKLEPKLSREELRAITTIGILNGAKQAEQQMENNIIEVVKDLILNTNMSDKNFVLPKIKKIEDQLERDQKALEILTKSLDMATKSKDPKTFRKEMLDILKTLKNPTLADETNRKTESDVGKRVGQLRKQILKQVDSMKHAVDDKIDYTLEYLIDHAEADGPVAIAGNKVLKKRQTEKQEPARIRQIKSILTEDDFRNNLIDEIKTDNKDDSLEDDNLLLTSNNVIGANSSSAKQRAANVTVVVNVSNTTATNDMNPAKQEEGSPELLDNDDQPPAGGGGLVGIISSLSGGEGGSDIGALIGALTGVISQIFGPGGLDIETLISSATSLISGLLAGDKNFGTVLGIYVGTAFDGLSGGGGAVNNGQFIGNFLGTVVASLSADPEEDGVPPKPLIFLRNLATSFLEAKNRPLTEEESSELENKNTSSDKGGSDSVAFIKQIVSHVVGGVVRVILNTSLGASSGASQASSSLFVGSSAGHKPALATLKG